MDGVAETMLKIHDKGTHTVIPAPQPRENPTASRTEKVHRPTISAAGTAEDWTYFASRWDEYKAATGVAGHELVLQLLECCDEEL